MSAPFMQLYVADYLGDTRHLTTEQHGAYLLLLMTVSHAGDVLPNDDKKLARMVGCTPSRWGKIREDVLAFFTVTDDGLTSKHIEAWERESRRLENRPPLPAITRAFVLERDGYCCAYCQTTDGPFEVDHILAVALGGGNELENLTCACKPCNRSKGAKRLSDWVAA